jgi:hypothetical protein
MAADRRGASRHRGDALPRGGGYCDAAPHCIDFKSSLAKHGVVAGTGR